MEVLAKRKKNEKCFDGLIVNVIGTYSNTVVTSGYVYRSC
jgi:hypothetical protein